MRKERTNLELRRIKRNDGQLEWLPKNPRQWTQTDIDRTAASIAEDEDFLEDRPLLVTPYGDEYIVFAGNLRREGAKKQKMKTVPAVVYYPETDEDALTIKRRAMKDNGSFGAWDYDALANEWDDLPLQDWGVPAWEEEEGGPLDGETEKKQTELLSGLSYEPLYFEPTEKPNLKLEDCYDTEKFDAKLRALDEYQLTKKQKELLKVFAYRFIKIDFEAVANYYYFNASEEEKKAIERLRLVLVDDGSIAGFAEDGLLKVAELAIEDARDTEE